ncbi:hypothetical protein GPECTOR_1g472 [Gonium pectorale]|uniref:Uncharacterized protein n=1 Tax=Gonium pectorale TaxID=33097 RepID=A0A150H2X6_GONPE|nr:hypothetical protein GPECTOR_1g472 [Gonium pectorale]|eukprot:KXZ56526.1 hypothetical protein GPECTOR_1g472 [Gonium pectorale]
MHTSLAAQLLRRNSRKDIATLGTLFTGWSGRAAPRNDALRRMTMGGAGPDTPVAQATPAAPAYTDAFSAVQLQPTNSLTKQESAFLLSPKSSLAAVLTPTASLKDPAGADGPLLSPTVSKTGLEAILASSVSFRASAEVLLSGRANTMAGTAAPSALSIST